MRYCDDIIPTWYYEQSPLASIHVSFRTILGCPSAVRVICGCVWAAGRLGANWLMRVADNPDLDPPTRARARRNHDGADRTNPADFMSLHVAWLLLYNAARLSRTRRFIHCRERTGCPMPARRRRFRHDRRLIRTPSPSQPYAGKTVRYCCDNVNTAVRLTSAVFRRDPWLFFPSLPVRQLR